MLKEKQVSMAEECTVKRNKVEQHRSKMLHASFLYGQKKFSSLNSSLSYADDLLYIAEFVLSVLFRFGGGDLLSWCMASTNI